MTRETITLSHLEQRRAIALTAVLEQRLSARGAADLLGLSLRHVRRLLAAFRRAGPAALAHGNRGRPPHNRVPARTQQRVVTLARTTYAGFNHQHLTEILAEEQGIRLSRPTIRHLLLAAGLPSPRTRRPRQHRRRRARMPQAGLLVQIDGSHHDWLEGRGPRLVLHGAIDDATNAVPAAVFRLEEEAAGYLWVLRAMALGAGLPVALYSDRHGIFERAPSARALTLDEQLQGVQRPRTQVGRALDELGIRWIPAASPQAKGRIERLWGTFQDRLVSELRRAGARSLDDANTVLAAFLPRYNRRFARSPASPAGAYRPLPPGVSIEDICCFKYERIVANDNTVKLEDLLIQILPGPQRRSYAKARIRVHEYLDGTLAVVYQGQHLPVERLSPPAAPAHLHARNHPGLGGEIRTERETRKAPPPRRIAQGQPWKPAEDHPWKEYARRNRRRRELREAGVTFSQNT